MMIERNEPAKDACGDRTGCCGGTRRLAVAVIGVLLIAGMAAAIKYGRYHFLPRQFAVVEPGRLYRSGYCEPRPLTKIIHEHRIKTILTLLDDQPDSAKQQKEESVVRREGVDLLRIPMPGDGRGRFEQFDQAAAIIADPSRQPILVHCAAGVNRTSAAYVAYRMKYCGWTFEQAMAEAEANGYSPSSTPQLREHLQAYAATLGNRSPATAPATRASR